MSGHFSGRLRAVSEQSSRFHWWFKQPIFRMSNWYLNIRNCEKKRKKATTFRDSRRRPRKKKCFHGQRENTEQLDVVLSSLFIVSFSLFIIFCFLCWSVRKSCHSSCYLISRCFVAFMNSIVEGNWTIFSDSFHRSQRWRCRFHSSEGIDKKWRSQSNQ